MTTLSLLISRWKWSIVPSTKFRLTAITQSRMADALTQEKINDALSNLPGWSFADDKISKDFEFKHFKEAMGFIVRVGFEAEAAGHHPELFNVYNKVTISLSTHDAGGKVTHKDLDLATAIEHFDWT